MERHKNVVPKFTSEDIYRENMARHGISDLAERNPSEKAYLDEQRYRSELVAKIAAVGAKISAANKGTDNALGQLNIVEAINILRRIEKNVTQAIEGLIEKETDISTRIEKVGGSSKLIEATARKMCEVLAQKTKLTPKYYENLVKESLASLESRKSRDGNRQ